MWELSCNFWRIGLNTSSHYRVYQKTLFSKISKVQPTKHQPGGLVWRAPVESRVSSRIDARASFVNDVRKKWDRYDAHLTCVSCWYDAHLTCASKSWPICQMLIHLLNFNPFFKLLHVFKIYLFLGIYPFSKFWSIFKKNTHF